MWKRIVAAAAGAAVAIGFNLAIDAMAPPPRALTQAAPMHASEVKLPPVSVIPAVDPTPARLVIPAIGVDAKVEARGLDSDRNLATASDYRDVAWYDLGPRPGEPGNAIVNGHVNWWTGDAVFAQLSRLRVGDAIRVTRADGGLVEFKVTGKHIVDANARIAALFAPSSQATLTLITCTGAWNPLTQSDTQRLLVSATRV
jgi:LPXTG-site transpeptidase (sortase) family protein